MQNRYMTFSQEKSEKDSAMREYFDAIYKEDFASFSGFLEDKLNNQEKTFIITANPETLMIGRDTPEFDQILKSNETVIVPDGIGVVKAANILGIPLKERITGIEIVQKLFGLLNEKQGSLFLFGAQKEVLEKLVERLEREYPEIRLAGYCDGYVKDKDAVFQQVEQMKPDVVLVALGIPAQEILIHKHYKNFDKGIFIGVGGSFDVLSGVKKRAPKLFVKLNLEWLYRITTEPKRLNRFYQSNIRFISIIKKLRK